MRIDCDKGSRIDFFKDLYETARMKCEELYADMEKNMLQYRGDRRIDANGKSEYVPDATQIRNITYELVESQVTTFLPTPAIKPKNISDRSERNAKAIESLINNKLDELNFEKMNDMDERFSPIYGGSVWLVEWDDSIVTHDTVGDVRVTCLPPRRFTGQPGIYEIEDMEYCFLQFETTKEDIERRYGISWSRAQDTESDENTQNDETATLYVCYYKDEERKVCMFVWSGDVVCADEKNYYSRRIRVCKHCHEREELCRCDHRNIETVTEDEETLYDDIPLSDGSVIPAYSTVVREGSIVTEKDKTAMTGVDGRMAVAVDDATGMTLPIIEDVLVPKRERTKLPFYRIDRLPVVIRKNTSEEDKLFGQSDCEFIRPQQQAVNKLESRIMEKTMNSAVYPVVPDNSDFAFGNTIYEQVIKLKPGQSASNYGCVDLQVSVAQDIAESDRVYNHAKRILGISDSFQGQYDASAKSGIAKQVQVQQSAGRLDSKRQMKNAAYAEIFSLIFKYYLSYADEPRPASYLDGDGRLQNVSFNRYDFLLYDEYNGKYYYDDAYLFSASATVDIDKQRETLWQENRLNFQQGAYGDPASPETMLIFWQNMERAHYPFAHDNVERFRKRVAEMRQMQELQAQNQSLAEENNMRRRYEEYLKNAVGAGQGVTGNG